MWEFRPYNKLLFVGKAQKICCKEIWNMHFGCHLTHLVTIVFWPAIIRPTVTAVKLVDMAIYRTVSEN